MEGEVIKEKKHSISRNYRQKKKKNICWHFVTEYKHQGYSFAQGLALYRKWAALQLHYFFLAKLIRMMTLSLTIHYTTSHSSSSQSTLKKKKKPPSKINQYEKDCGWKKKWSWRIDEGFGGHYNCIIRAAELITTPSLSPHTYNAYTECADDKRKCWKIIVNGFQNKKQSVVGDTLRWSRKQEARQHMCAHNYD